VPQAYVKETCKLYEPGIAVVGTVHTIGKLVKVATVLFAGSLRTYDALVTPANAGIEKGCKVILTLSPGQTSCGSEIKDKLGLAMLKVIPLLIEKPQEKAYTVTTHEPELGAVSVN